MKPLQLALTVVVAVAATAIVDRIAWTQECDRNCAPNQRDAHGCCPSPSVAHGSSGAAAGHGPNYAVAATSTPFSTRDTGSWIPVPGLSVDITTSGGPVMLLANVNLNMLAPGAWGAVTLFRGDTDLGEPNWGFQLAGDVRGNESTNFPSAITFVDTPAAGRQTYSVRVRVGNTGIEVQEGARAQLAAYEMR